MDWWNTTADKLAMHLCGTGSSAINLYHSTSRLVASTRALHHAVLVTAVGSATVRELAFLGAAIGPALFERVHNGMAVLKANWMQNREHTNSSRCVVDQSIVKEAGYLCENIWEAVAALEVAAVSVYRVMHSNLLVKRRRCVAADDKLRVARNAIENLAAVDSHAVLLSMKSVFTSQPRVKVNATAHDSMHLGEVSSALNELQRRFMSCVDGPKSIVPLPRLIKDSLVSCSEPELGFCAGQNTARKVRKLAHAELLRSQPCGQQLNVSKEAVRCVSVSPNGAFLATGGRSRCVVVWNMATGDRMHALHGDCELVTALCWSPGSMMIAAATMDCTATVWNVATGEQVMWLKGHQDLIEAICWSPDRRFIATGSWEGLSGLWDATNGQGIRVLQGHSDHVGAVAWSPDSKLIATGSRDRTCGIWDPESGKLAMKLTGHCAQVSSVTWSPDGTKVATGSWDSTAAVWDVATGAKQFVLRAHTRIIHSIAWSPDGRTLVTGSYDRTAVLWDLGFKAGSVPAVVRVLGGHCGSVNSASWSVDGRHVVTGCGDGTVRVFRICV